MKIKDDKVIALDFDGTVVKHAYPKIGEEIGAGEALLKLQSLGYKFILNTMRCEGKGLEEAIGWFDKWGIKLYGVQENPTQKAWTTSTKVYAPIHIDDAALGAPLVYKEGERPYICWDTVLDLILNKKINKAIH